MVHSLTKIRMRINICTKGNLDPNYIVLDPQNWYELSLTNSSTKLVSVILQHATVATAHSQSSPEFKRCNCSFYSLVLQYLYTVPNLRVKPIMSQLESTCMQHYSYMSGSIWPRNQTYSCTVESAPTVTGIIFFAEIQINFWDSVGCTVHLPSRGSLSPTPNHKIPPSKSTKCKWVE